MWAAAEAPRLSAFSVHRCSHMLIHLHPFVSVAECLLSLDPSVYLF